MYFLVLTTFCEAVALYPLYGFMAAGQSPCARDWAAA